MSVYDNGGDQQAQAMPISDSEMQDMLGNLDNPKMMPDMSNDMLNFDLDLNSPPYLGPVDSNQSQTVFTSNAPVQSPVHETIEGTDNQDTITENRDSAENDDPLAQVGAGPLPTGFGVQLPANVGSSLTEFTKRRNWSQRVVEELKDFLYILSPDQRLIYVSPSAKSLTGYEAGELVGQVISNYIHQDDKGLFNREFHESISTGNPLRFFYRFRRPDGSHAIFETRGHPHFSSENSDYGGNSFCRGFFMMARVYPTKNAALLDSMLEHKIENERLKKRIAELKREEQLDIQAARTSASAAEGPVSPVTAEAQATPRPSSTDAVPIPTSPHDYDEMRPPAKPQLSSAALTQRNLNEALAESRSESINDKMARYAGTTHVETIEMLTGLRYREGERSKGISTGAESPMLVRGDQGIDILVDKDGRPAPGGRTYSSSPYAEGDGDKKKTIKVADEYVCTDCGTLDSPEWRRGPTGPKTLCNACGLRWAKKEKKRTGTGDAMSSNGNGNGGAGGPLSGASSELMSVPPPNSAGAIAPNLTPPSLAPSSMPAPEAMQMDAMNQQQAATLQPMQGVVQGANQGPMTHAPTILE
ncbi:MAG: blue light receptor [Chrysothrix sp. TS-e1954]|nr:MAG: blue light receptor [Chrysothrix sp. TS-e1954]